MSVPINVKLPRFVAALGRAAADGFPVASEKERDKRQAICTACEFWKPDGNWGLGECTHKDCGCTQFKWWLLTERCPMLLW